MAIHSNHKHHGAAGLTSHFMDLESLDGSEYAFHPMNQSGSASKVPAVYELHLDPENTVQPNTAIAISSTTTSSELAGPVRNTTPLSFPFFSLIDIDIDGLSEFPTCPSRLCLGDTTEPVPFDPADLEAALLTRLNPQHAFAFSLHEEPGESYPTNRRNHAGFPQHSTNYDSISPENGTNKK